MTTLAPPTLPSALNGEPGQELPLMSFEEFLERADEDVRAEWVNGKVEYDMTATAPHQMYAQFFSKLIQTWDEEHHIGGVTQTGPYPMLLSPVDEQGRIQRGTSREPDVLYVLPENSARVQRQYLNGPADTVVEIISPESRRRDNNTKYHEYERAGVREYWTHDIETDDSAFYRLDATGFYRRVELENEGTLFRSEVLPGFTLDLNWLVAKPLPYLTTILRAWGLLPPTSEPPASQEPTAPELPAA